MQPIIKLCEVMRRDVSMVQHKEPAFSAEVQTITSHNDPELIPNLTRVRTIDDVTTQEILRRSKLAKIYDERDMISLFQKLKTCSNKGIEIVIDAISDEPYISSQMVPIIHMRQQLLEGIRLAMKVVNTKKCRIEVYRNVDELENRVPFHIGEIPVTRISGMYPTDVRTEGSLMEHNGKITLYLGSIAMVHLARAVYKHHMHQTTIVTVAGDCIANPCNIEAGFDIPVTDLIDRCGLVKTPTRIVLGGSMTGTAIEDTDTALIKVDTIAVLALTSAQKDRDYHCIRCGRCNEVCPAFLNPMLLNDAIKLELHSVADQLDYSQCTQCMCCSFECPAKINIAANIGIYTKRRGEN